MPKHNREKPKAIRVIFTCLCGNRMSIYSKGDWKNKTCWNCLASVKFTRHPPPMRVEINGQAVAFTSELDEEDEEDE